MLKWLIEVMKMGKKKYFFFDIDGTLAVGTPGDQYVPESARKTIKELEAKQAELDKQIDVYLKELGLIQ